MKSISVRLWAKVDKYGAIHPALKTPCWVWRGSQNAKGYGLIAGEGRPWRCLRTHRVAWEVVNGPIPVGLCVLHRCDNPPCCNPDHLFLGTQFDNTADRNMKGRNPMAVKTHCAQGHEYTEANTYRNGGQRHCKTCGRRWSLEYFHRTRL